MKRIYSLTILVLLSLLTVFSFVPKMAFADGMVVRPNIPTDNWDFSNENSQQVFINHSDGLQKMIVSIGLDGKESNGAMWLLPIPADPSKVTVDIVGNLPQLSGKDLSEKAISSLDSVKSFLQGTQIYTLPYVSMSSSYPGTVEDSKTFGLDSIGATSVEPDVIVSEHLEKDGVTSEIVTAKTASGLYNYLISKGLKIESGSIPVLDGYIGKDYSFIASWINSSDVVSPNIGIYTAFPTKDIYFPLLPTSVYGSTVVPATIRVIGYVSPKVFQDIKSYTATSYYINGTISLANDIKSFYSGDNDIKYTKIEINAPSKFLTNDLWISNRAPIKACFSAFVAKYPVAVGAILFILCSVIAGILAGVIAFKDLRKKPVKLGLIGLSNILSLFGLYITTVLAQTKNHDKNLEPLLTELKKKGYYWKRRLALILFYVAWPFLLLGLFSLLTVIGNIYNSGMVSGYDFAIILVFYILPISALIFAFVIRKIKTEDRNLFDKLKSAKYSLWSLQPKDKLKWLFVPVYSVIFLIIVSLLVALVELVV